MIDKYLEITKKIATACGVFAAASIMLSIVIVTELVFERYIFGNAITWQTRACHTLTCCLYFYW